MAAAAPEQIVTISPKQLASFIEECFYINETPCAWGPPGVGKSQIVHQVALRLGLPVYEVRLAQMDGVDVRGLPYMKDGRTHWGDPSCFPPADLQGGCIVFLDEANRAPVSVQNAGFQAIDQHRIGDYTFPKDTHFVLACNREGDGGGVNQMPAALANRLIHGWVAPSWEDWVAWAPGADVHPLVIAYVKWQHGTRRDGEAPKVLLHFDPKAKSNPTPRAVEKASSILKRQVADRNLELALLAGAIGVTEALALSAFVRLFAKLPDIRSILADPDNAPVPEEVGVRYAVAATLSRVADDRNLPDVIRYLERLPGEYNVFAIKTAKERDAVLAQTPAYVEWRVRHQAAA
jgi:hypothetical protein